MSLNVIQGLMGDGKSYTATNKVLRDWIVNSNRPIATNLPLELENFLMSCSSSPAKRDRIRKRIKILENRVVELPELTEEEKQGFPEEELKLRPRTCHELREFWWVTEANSVIILDECGDIYNSLDRQERPKELQSFINHHRHYKYDIYFICQSAKDLDAQVRRKIQFLWTIRNSVKENMFGHALMRGIRWPIQFFMIKVYSLPAGFEDTIQTRDPSDQYTVWPSRRGYRNYRSFSVSGKLPGKKVATEDDESGDFSKKKTSFLRTFWGQSHMLIMYLTFMLTLGFFGYRLVRFLLDMGKNPSLAVMSKGAAVAGQGGVPHSLPTSTNQSVPFQSVTNAGIRYVTNAVPVRRSLTNSLSEPPQEKYVPEKIVLKSRYELLTNKRRYMAGDQIGTNIIRAFLLDGVLYEGGGGSRYESLKLQ